MWNILYATHWYLRTNETPTRKNYSSFVTNVDDFSRFARIILIKHKFDFSSLFTNFNEFVLTQFNKKIKIVRTKNARELSEGETLSFYNAKGIKHQTSCVDTPQQTFLKLLEHCFFNQKYLRLFGVIVCNVQHTWSIKCPSLFWTKKFPLKYYILRHHHMICSSPLVALPMLQLWKGIDPNLIQEHKGQQLNNGQQLSKYTKVGLFKNN